MSDWIDNRSARVRWLPALPAVVLTWWFLPRPRLGAVPVPVVHTGLTHSASIPRRGAGDHTGPHAVEKREHAQPSRSAIKARYGPSRRWLPPGQLSTRQKAQP